MSDVPDSTKISGARELSGMNSEMSPAISGCTAATMISVPMNEVRDDTAIPMSSADKAANIKM